MAKNIIISSHGSILLVTSGNYWKLRPDVLREPLGNEGNTSFIILLLNLVFIQNVRRGFSWCERVPHRIGQAIYDF